MKKLCFGVLLASAFLFAQAASADPCGLCQAYYPCDYPCEHCVEGFGGPGLWTNDGYCWGEVESGTCATSGNALSSRPVATACVSRVRPALRAPRTVAIAAATASAREGRHARHAQATAAPALPIPSVPTVCASRARPATTARPTAAPALRAAAILRLHASRSVTTESASRESHAAAAPGTAAPAPVSPYAVTASAICGSSKIVETAGLIAARAEAEKDSSAGRMATAPAARNVTP